MRRLPRRRPARRACAPAWNAAQNGQPWIFAVATDMPFMRPALIEQLATYRAGVDAVVPLIDGHPQPLAAFYSINALPIIRAHGLSPATGKRSLRAALERLQVAYVHAADLITADPGLDSFVDLDTPEDLAKAINQKEG
jgi:molybdopterin-guanine dinucleotide biosynthesis protein A